MTAATAGASKAASNATVFAFAALAALIAIRLMLAKHLELHFDEANYWYWSKNLQLSYFDHPPAVAWFIRAETGLFGDTELGVRFFWPDRYDGGDLPAIRRRATQFPWKKRWRPIITRRCSARSSAPISSCLRTAR